MQVIWQLSNGERSFLPRLGAAIVAITACRHDPAKFVVCQGDNTIRVVRLMIALLTCLLSQRSHSLTANLRAGQQPAHK